MLWGVSCPAAMAPKMLNVVKFFLWAMLMMGMDLKISFGHALEGFMSSSGAAQNMVLPKNFVLFPSGLLAGLWLVGRPLAGVLLPKNFVLFPFGVSFWLVSQPSAGLLLPQNLVRGLNFFLSFPVKSLREPRSK